VNGSRGKVVGFTDQLAGDENDSGVAVIDLNTRWEFEQRNKENIPSTADTSIEEARIQYPIVKFLNGKRQVTSDRASR
jgi:hypothetical protein